MTTGGASVLGGVIRADNQSGREGKHPCRSRIWNWNATCAFWPIPCLPRPGDWLAEHHEPGE